MAITDGDNGMVMPVAPYGGYGGNSFGNGDGSWWILLLFILLGGWGNGFNGGYGGGAGFVDNTVQRGFDQSAIMSGITGVGNNVVSGFGDTATNLCGGFAGVTAAINNGFSQAEMRSSPSSLSVAVITDLLIVRLRILSQMKQLLLVLLFRMVCSLCWILFVRIKLTVKMRRFLSFRTLSTWLILQLPRPLRPQRFLLSFLHRLLQRSRKGGVM